MAIWKKILLLACAAALTVPTTAFARQVEDDPRSYTVACIGDSLTFGTGSDEPGTQSWPSVLAQESGELSLKTYNFGVYGSTVEMFNPWSYNSTACFAESLRCDADVYLIMLGSNDTSSPAPDWTFEEAYRGMLECYTSLPQSPTVVVLLPPDLYFHNYLSFTNEEIVHIRDTERQIAAEFGLNVIDLSAISGDMEQYCVDGGHYNSTGYAMFADYIYSELCNIL